MKGADLLSPAVEYQNSLTGLKLQEKVLLRSKNNKNPFAIGIYIIHFL
jgi:predicted ribosome-associated RNA-binding protein Tma20